MQLRSWWKVGPPSCLHYDRRVDTGELGCLRGVAGGHEHMGGAPGPTGHPPTGAHPAPRGLSGANRQRSKDRSSRSPPGPGRPRWLLPGLGTPLSDGRCGRLSWVPGAQTAGPGTCQPPRSCEPIPAINPPLVLFLCRTRARGLSAQGRWLCRRLEDSTQSVLKNQSLGTEVKRWRPQGPVTGGAGAGDVQVTRRAAITEAKARGSVKRAVLRRAEASPALRAEPAARCKGKDNQQVR